MLSKGTNANVNKKRKKSLNRPAEAAVKAAAVPRQLRPEEEEEVAAEEQNGWKESPKEEKCVKRQLMKAKWEVRNENKKL